MAKADTVSDIRKWKKRARKVVKRHYALLMILCLAAVFFGAEFGYVKTHTIDAYNFITGRDPSGTGLTFTINGESLMDVAADKVLGIDLDTAKQRGRAVSDQLGASASEKIEDIKGGQNGILSSAAGMFKSGQALQLVNEAAGSVIKSGKVLSAIGIILSTIISLLIYVFIKNVYVAILRRMFLEARTYEIVTPSHLLHFKLVDRWFRASMTMLLVLVYELLWWLTIIGGMIKHYSYLLVPYIVAENPDIPPAEAVNLSRRMMDGHKWEAFMLDASYIGWHLLGIFTFGIAEGLYVVPYKTAARTELYVTLRKRGKDNSIEGTDLLNDEYLYTHADPLLLEMTYSDIDQLQEYIDANHVELSPVKKFFARNFGLWIGSIDEKRQFDEVDGRRLQIQTETEALEGKLYPVRLNPLWDNENIRIFRSTRALRTYTIWSLILIFFIFSFVGWSWEVSIHLVKDGIFVNRGVMHGPWLPVYGSGVAMILFVLSKWRRVPVLEGILTILLCGVVEYSTSYYLEVTKGMRWWDYTGYFLNLDGRICGEGLLVFCIGGMAAVYLLAPIIDSMLSRIDPKILIIASLVLSMAFAGDMVYTRRVPNTGEGITDYEAYKQSSIVEETADTYSLTELKIRNCPETYIQ